MPGDRVPEPHQASGRPSSAWIRASCSSRCSSEGWVEVERLQRRAADRRGDEERVHGLRRPQVALRDGRDLAADLLQRGRQRGRLHGEVGAGPVGRQLAVALEQPEQEEADRVDDEADHQGAQHPDGALLAPRRPDSAPNCAPRVSMPATIPAEEATVMTRTSRWATWESSCASTASSSSVVSLPMMPVVTQTTARSGRAAGGERVGDVEVGDADPRLGHVGQGAEPVDHAVQLGRLLGPDLAGPHRAHRRLVAVPPLVERDPDAGQPDEPGRTAAARTSARRPGRRRARRAGT